MKQAEEKERETDGVMKQTKVHTLSAVHSHYFIYRAKAPHIRLRPGFLLGDFWEAY